MQISAIRLFVNSATGKINVDAEINGKFVTVIDEVVGGPICHITEELGMRDSARKAGAIR